MKVGLIVNPLAGVGGRLALKGSDDLPEDLAADKDLRTAGKRAEEALRNAPGLKDVILFTAGGEMGEGVLNALGLKHEVVHRPKGRSTREDTVAAVKKMVGRGVDLLAFCGGDGTAADVLAAGPGTTLCIGIPAGVKMHSAVFANTPEEAGMVIQECIRRHNYGREAEVMDIDEAAFRDGEVRAKLLGYLMVPDVSSHIQPPKGSLSVATDDEEKEELGEDFAHTMRKGVAYILGPGTTCKALADAIGVEKTLLGVDVIIDGKVVLKDADEPSLLKFLADVKDAAIVVTPIGRQGFIFGRGNQQISALVIEAVGAHNVIIFATPTKLRSTGHLRVDTGDRAVDERLKGFHKVRTGFDRQRMMKVE